MTPQFNMPNSRRDQTIILVTDSGGEVHEFPSSDGDVEYYVDFTPVNSRGELIHGGVQILTRTFAGGKVESDADTLFLYPRRVDTVFEWGRV